MNMNVNMTGKEYIEYKERRKLKLTKNQKIGLGIILGSLIVGGLAIALIHTFMNPTPPLTSKIPAFMAMGWLNLFKYGLIVAFPFIICSWILHGVQLRLLA